MPALFKLAWFFYALTAQWFTQEPLPQPVTNNAIAGYIHKDVRVYFSFMGLGPGKTYKDITRDAYIYTSLDRKWKKLPPVPGANGRLAAQAYASITGVLVFGGYTLDADGKERTIGDVDIYVRSAFNRAEGYWARGLNMPVPVDDAVIGAADENHIYLVSGWSNTDCVTNVQIYNPKQDHWGQATPIPGRPVFGHAGAVIDNYIVYLGGAYKNPDPQGPRY